MSDEQYRQDFVEARRIRYFEDRIRELESVEQAMREDLVKLAERCDRLAAELSVERHNLAITEHQRRELEAEVERLLEMNREQRGECEHFRGKCSALEAEIARLREELKGRLPAELDRDNLQAEVERLRATLSLSENKSFAADSRAPGC